MHDSISSIGNVVRYVRSSPKRLTKFKDRIGQEKIKYKALVYLDVATRLNSTYYARLCLEIWKSFQSIKGRRIRLGWLFQIGRLWKQKNRATNHWWLEKKVAVFVKFLKIFYDVAGKISGSLYMTSNSYFHELLGIRELLIQWSTNVNSVLSNMSSNMKVKYDS